jgi:hypothetical protein
MTALLSKDLYYAPQIELAPNDNASHHGAWRTTTLLAPYVANRRVRTMSGADYAWASSILRKAAAMTLTEKC